MASGIQVASDVVDKFNDIKLSHSHRYVIYKRNADNTEIVLEKAASKDAKYDDFVADLPSNECRYGIFDLEYSKSDADGIRQKIVFVVWAPDTAKIKDKMLTASSKDALKKQLVGISTEIQATDPSEIEYDYFHLQMAEIVARRKDDKLLSKQSVPNIFQHVSSMLTELAVRGIEQVDRKNYDEFLHQKFDDQFGLDKNVVGLLCDVKKEMETSKNTYGDDYRNKFYKRTFVFGDTHSSSGKTSYKCEIICDDGDARIQITQYMRVNNRKKRFSLYFLVFLLQAIFFFRSVDDIRMQLGAFVFLILVSGCDYYLF